MVKLPSVMGRLALLFACGAAMPVAGGDWPHWRGPSRDGIAPEPSGWPGGWPPKRLWSASLGRGCSSPIIVAGKLYATGWRDGQDTLYCLDARTGVELWRQAHRSPRYGRHATGDESEYGGPSSTPAFDATTGFLYTLSLDGELRCWNAAQAGKTVWAINLYDKFKAPQRPHVGGGRRDYGYPTAPLVRGGAVVVEVGAPSGTVMAFDKLTGERRWASEFNGPAGHTATPVELQVSGVPCLALLALQHLVVMRLDAGHEGKTVATTPWQTDFACNISTPAVAGGRILITSGYNRSVSTLFEATMGGLRQVWTSKTHGVSSSPVIFRDRIFLINQPVQCMDLATGKLRWRGGDFTNGSCTVTAPDGKLIVFGARKLVLLDALADEYRELARLDRVVPATSYPHVTLAGGILCCKDREGNLVAFSVAAEPSVAEAPRPPPAEPPPPPKPPTTAGPAKRAADGLVALYSFQEATEKSLGLRLRGAKLAAGALRFDEDGIAESPEPPARLVEACKKSNEITIEAWLTPANTTQDGPARIVSLSADPYKRNFTLGQEGARYEVRLRTTRTGENGMNPALSSRGGVETRLAHVVYTRAADGKATLYLNGEPAASAAIPGDLSNWEPGFRLALGNELTADRPWRGELRLAAVYSRALTREEVAANHRAGPPPYDHPTAPIRPIGPRSPSPPTPTTYHPPPTTQHGSP